MYSSPTCAPFTFTALITFSMLVNKRLMIYTEAPTDSSVNFQVTSTYFQSEALISELKGESFILDSPCCTTCRGVNLSHSL